MKKYLVTVVGPTAVGKTQVSIRIAQQYKTAVISADARQFYKEMKIGTATPSDDELQLVPHYFISHLSVTQPYSAGDFAKDAIAKLDELYQTHDVVVATGGSGLFIRALTEGLDKFPDVSAATMLEVNNLYHAGGLKALQELLMQKDPDYYAEVDLNNPQRLIRALSVCLAGGMPYSSYRKKKVIQRNFQPVKIGLELERRQLYQNIDQRVDRMMEAGLLKEVQPLLSFAELNPLQTVGYTELFEFIRGYSSLEAAVALIKQHSRNYAKRQMTWFKKDKDIRWFHPFQMEEIFSYITQQLTPQV